jgi:diguanylate cyclase (GGDEF)-like protein/PAS domain S-box-containing protein
MPALESIEDEPRTPAMPLSRVQLRQALLGSPVPMCITDANGTCLVVNAAAAELLGRDAAAVAGLPLRELVDPADREETAAHFAALVAGGAPGLPLELCLAPPDGAEVRIAASLLRDDRGRPEFCFAQFVDLSAHRRAEARLRRRVAQQSAIAALGRRAIAGDHDVDALMDAAVHLVADTLGVEHACILERPAGESDLIIVAGAGGLTLGRRVPIASSAAGRVMLDRRPLVVPDILDDAVLAAGPSIELGLRSAASVPIGLAERPLGVLGAYTSRPRAFTDDDVHFLSSAANVIAEAMRRERVDAQLRHQALHDPVTGLPNRALLTDRLARALAGSRRAGGQVGVCFVDLDDFKILNDSLGHHAGDEVLREVGRRLGAAVRQVDTVARFGGDEFVVVAHALAGEDGAARLAETLLEALRAPFQVAGGEHFIGASLGLSLAPAGGGVDSAELQRDADTAMYEAKSRGRGTYVILDEGMRRRAQQRLTSEQDLRRAIAAGELRVLLQPLFRLQDETIHGAEALVRWQHPERGLLTPSDFLEVAQQSGLIVPIGEWVLREACSHAAELRARCDGDFLLTVNVSPRQLADPGFRDLVAEVLAESGLPPQQLGLEITEQTLIRDHDEASARLSALKELGVMLLLDDFGTGFSSLSHLKRFPIDAVKIDRTFVSGLADAGGDDLPIVSAILAMSWAMGKLVIPEGVETAGQADQLRRLGCRVAQGYHFARPMPVDELLALLDERATRAPLPMRGAELAHPLAGDASFASLLRPVLGVLERYLPGSAIWLGHLDDELGVLRIVDAAGAASFGLRAGGETPIEESLCHVMASGRGPQICGDAGSGPYGSLEVRRSLGVRSFVGVPIAVEAATLGTVCAISHRPDAYGEHEHQLLAMAAQLLTRELEAHVARGGDARVHLRTTALGRPV